MSEDEKAPKKAARKRVVKKGVRGSRAPRKKAVAKEEEDPEVAADAVAEDDLGEENEVTYSLGSSEPSEPEKTIEVVEEAAEAREEDDSSKNGRKEKPKKKDSKKGEEKSKSEESAEEESSSEEGDDRGEGRNRRGRNRRGGNRDREESGPKRAPVDKDEAAAKAWEIYQGELEEEGVSLVDPRRAREVARRCLELATIFCEERDRYLDR